MTQAHIPQVLDNEDAILSSYSAVSARLRRKQRSLISAVASIFPITIPSNSPPTICGVELPNSVYIGHDGDRIATALGYASHLVHVISCYLDIPLKYSMRCMSSRSTITDGITLIYRDNPVYALVYLCIDFHCMPRGWMPFDLNMACFY
jgi:hypothetical protein